MIIMESTNLELSSHIVPEKQQTGWNQMEFSKYSAITEVYESQSNKIATKFYKQLNYKIQSIA